MEKNVWFCWIDLYHLCLNCPWLQRLTGGLIFNNYITHNAVKPLSDIPAVYQITLFKLRLFHNQLKCPCCVFKFAKLPWSGRCWLSQFSEHLQLKQFVTCYLKTRTNNAVRPAGLPDQKRLIFEGCEQRHAAFISSHITNKCHVSCKDCSGCAEKLCNHLYNQEINTGVKLCDWERCQCQYMSYYIR